ncbi:MAG: glycosyltransferase family 4 protein [Acidobacteriota bacterium]
MSAFKSIAVLKGVSFPPERQADLKMVAFEELKSWLRSGRLLAHFLRYREARLSTYRLEVLPKPVLSALLIRFISRGPCWFTDEQGQRLLLELKTWRRLLVQLASDAIERRGVLQEVELEVEALRQHNRGKQLPKIPLDLQGRPVYLRTDLAFGIRSGGSISHIAGVLNEFQRVCGAPLLLTTDSIPGVLPQIETRLILPEPRYWDFRDVPAIFFNRTFERQAAPLLRPIRRAFLYQRYSLYNYTGVKLARQLQTPLVVEYNGSEVWVGRNWGQPLKYERLAEAVEQLNLWASHLIVVVSQSLKRDLLARGLPEEKILVNPNGVDPERYSPEIDGSTVLQKHRLSGKTVIGFIGTFGRWHGAEVLAEAFGRLIQEHPAYRDRIRLLMVGDGQTLPVVRKRLADLKVLDLAVLPGLVAQQEGPRYLAAADILVSPQVPNPDGSPFFGSPTKLFEYMAMGKAIVASDLDQIGEVLKDGHTALLVAAGDPVALAAGLKTLIEDRPLRLRIGSSARKTVFAHHTWREHTRRIIEKLLERCS